MPCAKVLHQLLSNSLRQDNIDTRTQSNCPVGFIDAPDALGVNWLLVVVQDCNHAASSLVDGIQATIEHVEEICAIIARLKHDLPLVVTEKAYPDENPLMVACQNPQIMLCP